MDGKINRITQKDSREIECFMCVCSKVGHVQFHPVASNVLASASTDLSIKLWDIEKGQEKQELIGHTEIIQSMSWNYNGSLLATTCRDKRLRIFDVRSNQVVQEGPGHQGIKGSRVVWLGESNRLATTGFSKMSDRQLNLWNSDDLSKPMKSEFIDTSSGVIMPFYDNDNSILYLAGKGYVWFGHKCDPKRLTCTVCIVTVLSPTMSLKTMSCIVLAITGMLKHKRVKVIHYCYLFQAPLMSRFQLGVAFMPKRALNVNECEIARAYKLTTNMIEPISFKVPRKVRTQQEN